MNEVARDAYVKDCQMGVTRWNRLIERAGCDFRMTLPSPRFRRTVGSWANIPTDTTGQIIPREAFDARIPDWLPTESDRAFIRSLMKGVYEVGKIAGWIAPPDRGVNNLDINYEYVKFH
jgi:benzoyl-CoA 2,3-dioxygenase component B